MTVLAEVIAEEARAGRSEIIRLGIVEDNDAGMQVNLGGAQVNVWWPDGWEPEDGDLIVCALLGQTWYAISPVRREPYSAPEPEPERSITGTVKAAPSGASRITVTVDGEDLSLRFLASYTPAVGNTVELLYQPGYEDDPLVLGQRGSTPVPTPPKPPAPKPDRKPKPSNPNPPKSSSGVSTFRARTTATWDITSGQWSSYQGRNVVQGSWYGRSSSGAWFYGTSPRNALRGRRITRARIYLPNRLRMGNYNSSATIALYRHSNANKPSGRWSRTGSATNVSVRRIGSTTGWVDIPVSWGQWIVDNAGGLGIDGSTYLGFPGSGSGSGRNPNSGTLRLNWEKS